MFIGLSLPKQRTGNFRSYGLRRRRTDFTNPIRNSLLKAEELELKVHTVVFGTDLGAPTPNFGYIEDQLEDGEIPPVYLHN